MKMPKVKLILYVISGSLHCQEANILLQMKGIKFERRDITGELHNWGFSKLPLLTTKIENSIWAEGLKEIKRILNEK